MSVEYLTLDAALYGRSVAKRALWKIILWYTGGKIRRIDANLVRIAVWRYAEAHGYPLDEKELRRAIRKIMRVLRE